MDKIDNLNIEIFADGADLKSIQKLITPHILVALPQTHH